MKQTLLSLSNLTKQFDGKKVLDSLNLDIFDGEFITLLGPSGCGKTTLLRMMAGFEHPDDGTIALGDQDLTHTPPEHRPLNTVFQNYALFANKTARENITQALITVQGYSKAEANARADATLRETGLFEKADSYPAALSGGQQQRVGIGRAMALDADLMLFDEPTSALDPEWVGEVLDLMRRVAEKRQTMLIVTHEIQFAREIADRIVFMDEGRIVEQGPPAELLDAPKDPRTQSFLRRVTG